MSSTVMTCRAQCGACCIAPGIHTPFFGMPQGKPAGVRCVHLTSELRCAIFADPRRPATCAAFAADPQFCGDTAEQALLILSQLDEDTRPELTL